MKEFVKGTEIRKAFERNLSQIYANEVPLYKEMLPLVEEMNSKARKKQNKQTDKPLVQEHHGAIRVGNAQELNKMSRLFNVMDMKPVNYYDLSVAGLPVHSTAFRDISKEGLQENSFRVFCSMLREDMISEDVRQKVTQTIAKRKIISDETMAMIEKNELQGGLTEEQADIFIKESTKTFQRNKTATVSKSFYETLLKENSLLADIASFKNPHINHLTPRTDDIDGLFNKFQEMGIKTTPIIQGPPKRNVPILLRQMAFQAIMEDFEFPDGKGGYEKGGHRARFGEYETKEDAAVTQKGRELYDKLLQETLSKISDKDPLYTKKLNEVFEKFPDTKEGLREQELVYFKYSVNDNFYKNKQASKNIKNFEDAVKKGFIDYEPVPYHDFLPVSAASIFKSNLVEGGFVNTNKNMSNQEEFEKALGKPVIDSFKLYEEQQNKSIVGSCKAMGIAPPELIKKKR
jgi:uncharacterized glyoxalase superfamily metalloenzyme YdcJ